MGKVLDQAFAEAAKLPDAEQEAFGAWMLEELAAEAVREDEAGLTQPLDPDAL